MSENNEKYVPVEHSTIDSLLEFTEFSRENIVRQLIEIERRKTELKKQIDNITDDTRAKILAGINGVNDNEKSLTESESEYNALLNFTTAIKYVYP